MRHLVFAAALALAALSAAPAAGQPIHPGKTGAALEALVRADYKPTNVLSYKNAKKALFTDVDVQAGQIQLLYTGDTYTPPGAPNLNVVNAEHVWPQSRFGAGGGQRSDLHHLFACYTVVNSTRGNRPFAEIPDAQTQKWWAAPVFLTGVPGTNIDHYSESTNAAFEPREADKGNVARAVFYFRAVYGDRAGLDLPFFDAQRATLLAWHAADPADPAELARNRRASARQGNRNPFVDDPTLAARMFGAAAPPPAGPASAVPPPVVAAPAAAAAGEPLQDGDDIHVMSWNLRFFYDADTSDNQSTLALDQSADSDAEFADRVKKVALVIRNAGMPQVVALLEVENEKVLKRLADELNAAHGGRYKVGFVQGTDSHTEQDVAFLYSDFGLNVTASRVKAEDFGNATLYKVPSKHCVLSVEQPLASGQTRRLKRINCHLKAGPGNTNEAQRIRQSRALNHFARATLAADPGTGVIVLGDTNASRKFENTTAADAMGVLAGLETADPLDDLTDLNGTMPAGERASHVGGKELGRILLRGALLDDTGLVFRQAVIRRDLIGDDESDHFPVVATFTYRKSVGP